MKTLKQRINVQRLVKLLNGWCKVGALLTLALSFCFFAFRTKLTLVSLIIVFFMTANMVAAGSLLVVVQEVCQFSARQTSKKELFRVVLFYGSFALVLFIVTAWFFMTAYMKGSAME